MINNRNKIRDIYDIKQKEKIEEIETIKYLRKEYSKKIYKENILKIEIDNDEVKSRSQKPKRKILLNSSEDFNKWKEQQYKEVIEPLNIQKNIQSKFIDTDLTTTNNVDFKF